MFIFGRLTTDITEEAPWTPEEKIIKYKKGTWLLLKPVCRKNYTYAYAVTAAWDEIENEPRTYNYTYPITDSLLKFPYLGDYNGDFLDSGLSMDNITIFTNEVSLDDISEPAEYIMEHCCEASNER